MTNLTCAVSRSSAVCIFSKHVELMLYIWGRSDMVKLPVSQLHETRASAARSMETPEMECGYGARNSPTSLLLVSMTVKAVDKHQIANPPCLTSFLILSLRAKTMSSLSSLTCLCLSNLTSVSRLHFLR